ncbi:MAG: hypothetical protein ABRQ37_11615, partial [Candidatus Eremiobacterota bacterium]
VCLGLVNQIRENNDKYSFSCKCHTHKAKPLLINSPDDWLDYLDVVNNNWPKNISEDDIIKLKNAIELIKKREYPEKTFLYNYEFHINFIRKLIKTTESRDKIIKSIIHRLISNEEESSKKPLRNEYITKKKEYRFRVTGVSRIHYDYIGNIRKKIRFLMYYGESEHDDGLK